MKKFLLASVLAVFGLVLQVAAKDASWQTDLPKAIAQAKAQKKLVLIDFTGSDWCGWCIKLDKETFAKPEFATYASKNLVLVELDFPRKKAQPAALKKANEALQEKYKVEGFPTLVALNGEGKEVWRTDGYLAGGPKALIAELEKAKKK